MKRLSFIIITIFLVSLFPVSAQEIESPGVTPDSFLWGLDKALDRIRLALTFDKAKKAEKGLEIAQERLLEVREMIEKNRLKAAERAREEHGKSLTRAKQNIADIRKDNVEDELESIIQVETGIEEHEERVEKTSNELKVKIGIEGKITKEQQELVDSILNTLKEQTGNVKVEIKNKRDDLKIRIRERTGESEVEIEARIKGVEKKKGLLEVKRERTQKQINEAAEEIEELKEEIIDVEVLPGAVVKLLEEAEEKLENAQTALDEENFGEAFGQATAAENLAKNAKRQLERAEEETEQAEEDKEIEVEVEEGRAKVKIEINDTKLRFMLDTGNRDEIINKIIERTGLTREDINSIIKFKEETGDEREVREERFKARIRESKRIEIEETESEEEEEESGESGREEANSKEITEARELRRGY